MPFAAPILTDHLQLHHQFLFVFSAVWTQFHQRFSKHACVPLHNVTKFSFGQVCHKTPTCCVDIISRASSCEATLLFGNNFRFLLLLPEEPHFGDTSWWRTTISFANGQQPSLSCCFCTQSSNIASSIFHPDRCSLFHCTPFASINFALVSKSGNDVAEATCPGFNLEAHARLRGVGHHPCCSEAHVL